MFSNINSYRSQNLNSRITTKKLKREPQREGKLIVQHLKKQFPKTEMHNRETSEGSL